MSARAPSIPRIRPCWKPGTMKATVIRDMVLAPNVDTAVPRGAGDFGQAGGGSSPE